MIRTSAIALALAAVLAGCQALQNAQTVSDAQNAVGKTATAVTTIGSSDASRLTKAQAAACAGQALANTVADMLTSTGHGAAAANAANVSVALGYGCSWT
ncbi:MAG: hypothetical protein WA459_03550, partial [Stellaceae bacterium]